MASLQDNIIIMIDAEHENNRSQSTNNVVKEIMIIENTLSWTTIALAAANTPKTNIKKAFDKEKFKSAQHNVASKKTNSHFHYKKQAFLRISPDFLFFLSFSEPVWGGVSREDL